jgi:hypothetical protein
MEHQVVGSLVPHCGVSAARYSAGVSQFPHNQHHCLKEPKEIKPLLDPT